MKQEDRTEHERMVFHIALKFFDCDEPFLRKLSESGKSNRPECEQPASSVGLGWRQGRLCVRQWGRETRTAVTQRAGVTRVVIGKPSERCTTL